MSISRGVFEGDINCDCIFTGFFEAPEAGGTAGKGDGDPGEKMSINRNHSRTECKNSLEMSILRGVFEGDINYDCIFTGFFEAPEAGGTNVKDTGGTRRGHPYYQHFK
jgi:hypothetical protein